MKRQKRTNNIYKQLIYNFILIILPIVGLSCILLSVQISEVKNGIRKNVASDLRYAVNRYENNIVATRLSQSYFYTDEDLRKLIREYDIIPVYEYYSQLKYVQNRIRNVMPDYHNLVNMCVYIKDLGIKITASSIEKITDEEYDQFKKAVLSYKDSAYMDNSTVHLSSVFSFPRWDQEYEMIFDSTLNMSDVFKNIFPYSSDPSNGFIIMENRSQNIYTKSSTERDQKLYSFLQESIASMEDDSIRIFTYKGSMYYIASMVSEQLDQTIYQYRIDDSARYREKVGIVMIVVYLLLTVIVAVVFGKRVKQIVMIPIRRLIESFRDVSDDHLDVQIDYQATDEFNYLYHEFNSMVRKLRELIEENYQTKIRAQQIELYAKKAELKQLQTQIHPHFLYNTYFMMHRMIADEDNEVALELSQYLGDYFEYIAHNAQADVFLVREVDYIRSYIGIQQMRFSGRIKLTIEEIPKQMKNLRIPRLTLQPLIENFIKHGYETSDDSGELYIRFREENGICCILIGGGCVHISQEEVQLLEERINHIQSEQIESGMINVHRRLVLRFGENYGIHLKRDEKEKLVCIIKVPIEEEKMDVSNSDCG